MTSFTSFLSPCAVSGAGRDACLPTRRASLTAGAVEWVASGEVIATLAKKPVIVGHSFGGLLAQIAAGRGLSAATVAIDPVPSRGVLALPLSALRSAMPVLANALNRHNDGVTEIVEIPERAHSLTIGSGWQEVAQTALDFIKRFA